MYTRGKMPGVPEPILAIERLTKTYEDGANRVTALREVDLVIRPGELVGLMGPSGCGKSTLLNLVGLIDRPSGGRVVIAGRDASRLDDDALTLLRRGHVGYVFQFFNLLPTLTLRENAALPLALAGTPAKAHREAAGALLAELGLAEQADRYPHQVSGGQMQRAAIARAIIHGPALVLADEPTGNLDSATGRTILDLLERICKERGQTILMATHSEEAAAMCDRIVRMRDGKILGDAANGS
jgi:ABC-type lipoprotein export system ATPase subunit